MITKRYGCRRDVRDARDFEFKLKVGRAAVLPPVVDLRKWCPPIMDQGDLGSCTANAITGVLRWHVIKAGGKADAPLSRLQLYYDERVIEKSISEDAGAELRDGIKVARDVGVMLESDWPYDPSRFKVKPPDLARTRSWLFGSLKYERVPVNVRAVKQALAGGFPVVIGISLFESFESEAVEKTGIVPMPNIETENMAGGHAMYVAGYGQRAGHFTVVNSWSNQWGDKGMCFIPDAYIGSPKFGSDYWVIRSVV